MPSSNVYQSLKRFLFILAFGVAAGSSAHSQEIIITPTGSKLVVIIKPEKDKILPGEPIDVAVEYRFPKPAITTAGTPWKQDVWPFLRGKITMSLLDQEGRQVARREILGTRQPDPFFGGSVYQYQCWTDEFTRWFFLPDWIQLQSPGKYVLRIETEFTTKGDGPGWPDPPQSSMFIVTGEGPIEVLPPNDALMGDVIRQIGERAQKTDFNDDWERLYLLNDPRTIPFVANKLKRLSHRSAKYQPTYSESHPRNVSDRGSLIEPAHAPPVSLAYLMSSDPFVNAGEFPKLVRHLVQFNDDAAMEALTDAARSQYGEIRMAVAEHLASCKHPKSLLLLASMCQDDYVRVRLSVAKGLAADSSPEGASALDFLAQDPDEDIHQAARRSLEVRKAAKKP